jgi:hypothetical protein
MFCDRIFARIQISIKPDLDPGKGHYPNLMKKASFNYSCYRVFKERKKRSGGKQTIQGNRFVPVQIKKNK